jgi:hypothetical protein
MLISPPVTAVPTPALTFTEPIVPLATAPVTTDISPDESVVEAPVLIKNEPVSPSAAAEPTLTSPLEAPELAPLDK